MHPMGVCTVNRPVPDIRYTFRACRFEKELDADHKRKPAPIALTQPMLLS